MSEAPRFTLVFDGDLRKVENNPFEIATPYGLPRAAGIGDALETKDVLLAAVELAYEQLAALQRGAMPPQSFAHTLRALGEAIAKAKP